MSSVINPNSGSGYGLGTSCCPELGYCESLLVGIQGMFGENNPSFKVPCTGALQSLFHPTNRNGVDFSPDRGDGHKSNVRIKYLPRRDYKDWNRTIEVCSEGDNIGYVEKCLEVNDACSYTFNTSDYDISRYCKEMSQVAGGQTGDMGLIKHHLELVMNSMGNIRTCIDTEVMRKLFLKRGVNVATGNNTIVNVNGLNADGSVRYEGIQTIISQYRRNQLSGKPLVIGNGRWDEMNTALGYGCCNDAGISFDLLAGTSAYYYFYDCNIDNAYVGLNIDDIAVLAPGSVQFLHFNKYKGFNSGKIGNIDRGVIADPFVPGLTYDLKVKYDDCKEKTNVTLSLNYDMYFIDDDAYLTGDPLKNSNGVLFYNVNKLP